MKVRVVTFDDLQQKVLDIDFEVRASYRDAGRVLQRLFAHRVQPVDERLQVCCHGPPLIYLLTENTASAALREALRKCAGKGSICCAGTCSRFRRARAGARSTLAAQSVTIVSTSPSWSKR